VLKNKATWLASAGWKVNESNWRASGTGWPKGRFARLSSSAQSLLPRLWHVQSLEHLALPSILPMTHWFALSFFTRASRMPLVRRAPGLVAEADRGGRLLEGMADMFG
jgi:hypothetical protein